MLEGLDFQSSTGNEIKMPKDPVSQSSVVTKTNGAFGRGRPMTHDEYRRYAEQFEASEGFAVDRFPGTAGFLLIKPCQINEYSIKYLTHYVEFAIKEHNRRKKKILELVKILKANLQDVQSRFFYLTLVAKDKDAVGDAATQTYQPKVGEDLIACC